MLACTAALADDPPVTTQIVDLANKLNGVHPGFRAFHAKGVVVDGSFKASPEAARFSRATLFNGHLIPVTVRFSDGNGMPNVADGSPAANPHGMAIKYHLPGGADTDMVTNSLNFFPAGTAEDFRDLLQAIIASPPDAPKPTKLEQFFASHPNAPKAFGTAATPDSYADEEYHGINAFIFVDKAGRRQAVRYLLVPEKLVHLTPEEAVKQPPDFLSDEVTRRIAREPVIFHLRAQLAEPGDQTKDGSQPWPDDRKVIELGVLTLNKLVANSLEAEKKLLFMPTSLTDGIELSDDPLTSARAAAYAVSFARRNQPGVASSGATQPSTVSPYASGEMQAFCPIQLNLESTVIKNALFVRLEANPGKEKDLAQFLQAGLGMAQQESTTPVWFALQLGPSTFGVFDAFFDEAGREAHLNGPIAQALGANARKLLAQAPSIERIDVLGAKLPG